MSCFAPARRRPVRGRAMSVLAATASAVDALVSDLASEHPDIEVRPSSAATVEYLDDAATRLAPRRSRTPFGPTVALPTTTEQVQQLVRTAARRGVAVVPRGAGSGLSGGASATADQLVISTERLTRIIEVSPLDEVAVVEPGVLNAELNAHLAAARPLLRARPGKLADLVDRRQHRHERGRTAVRQVRRHPGVGAGPRRRPRRRQSHLDRAPFDQGSHGTGPRLAVRRVRGHPGHRRRRHGAAPADSGGPAHRHGVLRHHRGRRCRARGDHRLARAPEHRGVLRPAHPRQHRPVQRRRPPRARRVAPADRARRIRHRRAVRRTA